MTEDDGRPVGAATSVRNGLNPLAGLTQAHYIKGEILLTTRPKVFFSEKRYVDIHCEHLLILPVRILTLGVQYYRK
jgi:hypothetical protein